MCSWKRISEILIIWISDIVQMLDMYVCATPRLVRNEWSVCLYFVCLFRFDFFWQYKKGASMVGWWHQIKMSRFHTCLPPYHGLLHKYLTRSVLEKMFPLKTCFSSAPYLLLFESIVWYCIKKAQHSLKWGDAIRNRAFSFDSLGRRYTIFRVKLWIVILESDHPKGQDSE